MSRIFEALKGMEAERAAHGAPDKDSLGVMELPELRRYPRRELSAPLTVYGRGPAGAPFYQEVDVVNVSADGGLIVMRTSVCEGQELLLINNHSLQEQLCHVVRIRSRDAETSEVGVTFPSPNPKLWEVSGPPVTEEISDEGF